MQRWSTHWQKMTDKNTYLPLSIHHLWKQDTLLNCTWLETQLYIHHWSLQLPITTPIYPEEHTAITALLGLLPTNAHLAIEKYISNYQIYSSYSYTSNTKWSVSTSAINSTLVRHVVINILLTTKTLQLSKFCTQLYHWLLPQLQNKAEKLQEHIQSVQISKYKASLPPLELTMPLQKPKQRPRIPCQGTWCALKQFAAMPYTMTTTSTNWVHCHATSSQILNPDSCSNNSLTICHGDTLTIHTTCATLDATSYHGQQYRSHSNSLGWNKSIDLYHDTNY